MHGWTTCRAVQRVARHDLVEQERSAEGCCSSTRRADGSSVLLTAVREDEGSVLASTLGPMARKRVAALLDEPQVAPFEVPDLFADAYRRRRGARVTASRTTATDGHLVG